ncbi:hypothetical protein V6N13_026393 [Hibiscus sabdariffa]|uniref:Uncharacterized protein n=1 Tax=Hibiscus sabdariffa TaxID=183260 RepID=A0ABR2P664_9ROSI
MRGQNRQTLHNKATWRWRGRAHALFIKTMAKLAGAHFYPACMTGAKLACCMHASLTGNIAGVACMPASRVNCRRRPPRGGLVVPTAGSEGRTGPPRGGEVDPTCKVGKPSQLPPTARAAQASFRPHQATSRWRGATVTVENGLVSKKKFSQPYTANFFPKLAYRANFA